MSLAAKFAELGYKVVQFPLSPKALEKVAESRDRVATTVALHDQAVSEYAEFAQQQTAKGLPEISRIDETVHRRPFDAGHLDDAAGWDADFKKARAILKAEKKKAEDLLVAIHHQFSTEKGVLMHVFYIKPVKVKTKENG